MFKLGHRYQITRFKSLPPAVSQKFLSVGLRPGVEFTVVRSSPFGDPLQLQLNQLSLCVRKSELALLEVIELDDRLSQGAANHA